MQATKIISLIIKAKNEASKELNKISGDSDKAGGSMSKMGAIAKGAAVAGITALGAALVNSVQQAASFETKITNISTLLSGDSTKATEALAKGIKNMTKVMPKSADELGASAYDIVSAGITDTSKALNVLEASTKLAVAGLGETQEATDIMTSSINAFGLDANDSNKIADILFKTVKAGKTTVSELAQSFGASAPIIASAGIKLEDFQAATAALTTSGLPASQAQMGLRQAIVSIIKPTQDMTKLFQRLGVKDGQQLIDTSENLGDVFGKLKGATNGNNEEWAKAISSVEALNAVTGLLDSSSGIYVDTLKNMQGETNNLDEAFDKQKDTFDSHWKILKNKTSAVMIDIGNKIIPMLNGAMDSATALWSGNIDSFNSKMDEMHDHFVTSIGLSGLVINKAEENKTATENLADAQRKMNESSYNLEIAQRNLINADTDLQSRQQELTGIQHALRLEVQLHGEDSEKAKELRNQLKDKEWEVNSAMEAVNTNTRLVNDATNGFKQATEDAQPAIEKYNDLINKTAGFLENIRSSSNPAAEALKGVSRGLDSLDINKWRETQQVSQETLGSRVPEYLKPNQTGGEVIAGRPYMVGEVGREKFVPRETGRIIPNNELNDGITINMTNNIIRDTDPMAIARQIGFELLTR